MTTTRRHWALVILGAWIAGSICMSVVATENFSTIDRLLGAGANAAFGAAVDRLGAVEARDLLRYLSSELNRLYFQLWNGTQIVLGVLALWLIAGPAKTVKWGITAMLAAGVRIDRRVARGTVPGGEAEAVHRGGGRYVSVIGRNALFHNQADRGPDAVDPAAIARFIDIFSVVAKRLAS